MIEFYVYALVLILAIIVGLSKMKDLDNGSKMLVFFLILTLSGEITAYKVALVIHNNLLVYSIFAPVQLLMLSLYYNRTVDAFRKKNIGIIIGILGIIVGVFCVILFPPVHAFSYFLVFEGFCVVSMSLWSFIDLIKSDQWTEIRFCHFLFSSIQSFFWSATYCIWALYTIFSLTKNAKHYTFPFLWIVNYITYFGYALVFLRYPKKRSQNG